MALSVNIPGGTVQLSGNPIYIEVTTDDLTAYDIHRLLVKVTSTDGKIPGGPWIDEIPVDANGKAVFDIHSIVDIEFDYEFDTEGIEIIVKNTALSLNVSVQIGELIINNGSESEFWGEVNNLTIFKGGMSNAEFNYLRESDSSFYDTYITGKKFLTRMRPFWTQTVSVARYDDWVKLWFSFDGAEEITPYIYLYYDDGTKVLESFDAFTPENGALYEFNAHRAAWYKRDVYKTLTKYQIGLGGAWFTVEVSGRYEENHNKIIFANSLSGVEYLHCYGDVEEITEIKSESYTVALKESNASLTDRTLKSGSKQVVKKYKINTGFKLKGELQWIMDCIASPMVLWESSGLLSYAPYAGHVPINIIPGSFKTSDSTEDLLAIEFEFVIANVDKFV